MPALFDQGFFVREPAWHGLGVVLDDYPDRETAMRLAGHDWDVITVSDGRFLVPPAVLKQAKLTPSMAALDERFIVEAGAVYRKTGRVQHLRSDTLGELHVTPDTFEPIANSVAYEIAEMLFDQGFQYETGITLDGGKLCAITLKLDEPITIKGDDSITLPFGCLSWAHDGSGSLKVRSGTIRQVCANTVSASEAEGSRLGTDFTFRHTKNVKERIEEAKEAVKGLREGVQAFREVMEELAAIKFTPKRRDLFVSEIIGDPKGKVSTSAATSTRVKNNIEGARADVLSLFMGPTIPEKHKLTGYGMFLAGGEYFDHVRGYRSEGSYVKRTLLENNPAKASLRKTIHKLATA